MAFIDDNEEDDLQQGGQGPQVGGSSSIVSSGGGSSAGQGAGAGGGFTNIQAYLNANKGDTGSSQALSSEVNSQFSQERDKFNADSSKFLSDAKNQAMQNYIAEPEAQKYIDQAASLYKYQDNGTPGSGKNTTGGKTTFGQTENTQEKVTPGAPAQEPVDYGNNFSYDDITKKFQNALTAQYSGPKEYNYGFDTKTQNYGSALKDNAGFDSLMTDVYSKAAKTPLTSGQYQLQKQFDVNNESLANTRTSLAGSYDQLGKDRDAVVTNTTKGLGETENMYRQNQNKLMDFLGNRANKYDTEIGKAEADARAQYGAAKQGASNRSAAFLGQGFDPYKGTIDNGASYTDDYLRSNNLMGDENRYLSWADLEREQNLGKNAGSGDLVYGALNRDAPGAIVDRFKQNASTLDSWNSAQDATYANTADSEERAFNAIQDFLNSGRAKKEQGFKVRG